MRKQARIIFENIEICAMAAEGKAIARVDNQVIFIPYGAPGDVVDLEITRKKSSYMEAKIIKFHQYSKLRKDAFCEHFGVCGGCKWQHIDYQAQLKQKEAQVLDHIQRIAKIEPLETFEILPSQKTRFYRNKLEYTFAPKRWLSQEEMSSQEEFSDAEKAGLGFHLAGMFDKVLDIKKCYLQAEPSNEIRLAIKNFALRENFSFYDVRKHEGLLRNLIIRQNTRGDFMLVLVFSEEHSKNADLLDFLAAEFPQITSLMYVINAKLNDSIADLEVQCFKGEPFITEYMPAYQEGRKELNFRIGPTSFYQTNAPQAYRLYSLAADFAELQAHQTVYDLYTGTGTIALFVAPYVKSVVGIEYVEAAVEDAKINAQRNQISNVSFFAGDMAKVFTDEFIAQNGQADLIITDPPRDGMHDAVIRQLRKLKAAKIVYVSCNSATQARDIEKLSDIYRLSKLRAVDMFPHTHHVESVALLELIS